MTAGKPNSVVLVSGGMDSLVTAALAAQESDPAFLHVSYGQRTEAKELAAFSAIALHYAIARTLVCDINYLLSIGGSSLTDPDRPVRETGVVEGEVPDSYVPFRNAHLVSIAVSWAEVIDAKRIYIGAVEEDSSGYPDCREGFFRAMEKAVRAGTVSLGDARLVTPLIHMSKSEIVRLGMELEVPFELSWSCYQGTTVACGVCDSCRLRRQAFAVNGFDDPIRYRP